MSVILMTTVFYKALILQGEIWCWSLYGAGYSLGNIHAIPENISCQHEKDLEKVKVVPARVKSPFWWRSGTLQLEANHIDRLNR